MICCSLVCYEKPSERVYRDRQEMAQQRHFTASAVHNNYYVSDVQSQQGVSFITLRHLLPDNERGYYADLHRRLH